MIVMSRRNESLIHIEEGRSLHSPGYIRLCQPQNPESIYLIKRTYNLVLKKFSEDLGILQCGRADAFHGRVLGLGEPVLEASPFEEALQPTKSMSAATKYKK